ncbi:amino acid transporter [Periconia macrospinosa]|uniref:Amino acid transporter n=1 Tax=Periconia macrospinosa TaxID=97972 RepID=A0A2V1DRM5_9PLEO|nr:amino acid transporter [Periconia macrospinosa]
MENLNGNKEFPIEDITVRTGSVGNDDAVLAGLGKKAVLKRRFSFLTILSYSCTVLVTWEASLILFLTGLTNGGSAGVIYGYILTWAGTVSTFIVLSELVSMAPTSGGQYHWVSMMAPKHMQKVLSYISGWLTLAGWQASTASAAYLTGSLIQGLMILTLPDYTPQSWHTTLLYWAITAFAVFINIGAGWLLPKFEASLLVLHILGFFAVLIPLLILGPKGNAKEVFTTFTNLGGWSSQGLSFCVGIMGTVFAFAGGDGPIHLSEEIQNAAVIVPRSIMTGIAINGSLGFAMVVSVLFRAGNIDEALEQNPLFPVMAIFKNAVRSTAGAAAMSSLIFILSVSSTVGLMASTSRIFWAFSRDRALPGWRTLSKVSPRTSIPVYSVITTAIIASILALVNIGSTTAFNGIVSISIAGLFASYLLVSSMLLYHRLTGGIKAPGNSVNLTAGGAGNLAWGPWRAPGVFGIANNIFACLWLIFVLFFSFWPTYAAVTPQTMNWSILVTGAAAIFSTVYYLVWARKVYTGPVVEIDVSDYVQAQDA